MRAVRSFVALAAALALAGVGCGGEAAREGLGSGADLAPASTAVFVAVNTDFEGDQWQAAEALVGKFPGGAEAIRKLLAELEQEDVDFERDVKPAVGPEVDFVVLDIPQGGEEPTVVALTQPRDEQKLRALLEKGDEPSVSEEIDGWTVVAENQAALDAFKQARGDDSLGESEAFEDAMGDLPDDTLVEVYVNGSAVTKSLQAGGELDEEERDIFSALLPGGVFPSFGAAVRAEDEGVRFEAAYRLKEDHEHDAYEAEFAGELPQGALVYLSFNDLAADIRDTIRRAGDANEDFDRYVATAELALGVSLEEDLLPLFENEGALVVYPPAEGDAAGSDSFPLVSLVLKVDDEEQARRTLDKIAERAAAFMEGIEVSETEIGGVQAKRVSFDDNALFYAAFDGKVVVTTEEEGISSLGEEGSRLTDDSAYQQAREAAGAPDETVGFAYANLAAAVDYLLTLDEAAEVPADVRANLEPLESFFAYATAEDDRFSFEGFLEID